MKKALVTGAAGFIGFHTAKRLIQEGYSVAGLDNINDYYDVNLKYGRLKETGVEKEDIAWGKAAKSKLYENYCFYRINLEDTESIIDLFQKEKFEYVIHLAAQAGVRYSLVNPHAYVDSNIKGFLNILEACRKHPVKHLVYASTSSVYGANTKMPYAEHDNTDHPVSLYAATKKANELMAYSYSHLYNIPTTGLRFFTVYGPWGRPDMALFKFTKAILDNQPIDVYNNGNMLRDFTYIDDIVEGIYRVLQRFESEKNNLEQDKPAAAERGNSNIYNIGNSKPVQLLEFIEALEKALGKIAIKNMMPLQPGDMQGTWADVEKLSNLISYKPNFGIIKGISLFVDWYIEFFHNKNNG